MKNRLLLSAKWLLASSLAIALTGASVCGEENALRVFLWAGDSQAAEEPNYGHFRNEWQKRLSERGIEVTAGAALPAAEQLETTDVLVIYVSEGNGFGAEDQQLEQFVERGGGLVLLHRSAAHADPDWMKGIAGGSWAPGEAKSHLGEKQGLYLQDFQHPITADAANFDLQNEEVLFELKFAEGIEVLATSYHHIAVIQPQMWVYENKGGRAFVWLQGQRAEVFDLPHTRALLLRAIAWVAGKDPNQHLTSEELESLPYPEGGPVHPSKAAETIVLHPEFNLKLVASEPMIVNPISIEWDARGRLWVAETPEYPFKHDKERPGLDRISILEDTTGDGVMDKKTIFYEGLGLATSLALYRDGVIVTQAPDILWLRDTDGDGRADTRETILTGFGHWDTHAVVSNMRWGLDGWIYATLGYSRANPQTPDGAKSFGQLTEGVLRFRPDGRDVQKVSSRGGNTWGVDIGWDGEVFWTQATSGDHLLHVVLPDWILARGRAENTHSFKVTEDHYHLHAAMKDNRPAYVQVAPVGGITAGAGCTLYTGGAWPDKFNYNQFISEPTIWLVHRDVLHPDGISFRATRGAYELENQIEFMAGRDLWFCPIHHRIGPDGAMYVVDFYNQAVSHNDIRLPGDLHGPGNAAIRPDRDNRYGRIWRVQHREARAFEAPRLHEAGPGQLVRALEHPNAWFRATAQQLLVERGEADVAAALQSLLVSDKPAYARLHALWTLEHLGALPLSSLAAAIRDRESAVRKNALRIVTERGEAPSMLEPAILEQVRGDDLRSRLEAFVALGSLPPNPETLRKLVELYPDLEDGWQQSAVLGVLGRAPVEAIQVSFDADDVGRLEPLAGWLTDRVAASQAQAADRLVIFMASKPARTDLLKRVVVERLSAGLPPEVRPAWSRDLRLAFERLLDSEEASLGAAAIALVSRWDEKGELSNRVGAMVKRLINQVGSPATPDADKGRMAVILLSLEDRHDEVVAAVAAILDLTSSMDLQRQIITALGQTSDLLVADKLIEVLPALAPQLQSLALDQLLRRGEWTRRLVEALDEETIAPGLVGPAGLHRLRRHPDSEIATSANKVLDRVLGRGDRELEELISELLPVVRLPGDAANGKTVFQNCTMCHRYEGEGNDLGPGLTGIGAHDPAFLLRLILDRSRLVDSSYIAYDIETDAGEFHTGLIVQDEPNRIVLRNATEQVEIPRGRIVSIHSTGQSIMPGGFETLGAENLRDLFTFLRGGREQYRILHLEPAFTADTTRGLYASQENITDAPLFNRFGVVEVEGVPFEVVHPARTSSGNNTIVLRGGSGFAKALPQRVEVPVGVAAKQLHFLGGIAGWGYPYGNAGGHHVPVLKATLHYAGGGTEEIVMHNGDEFSDWIRRIDVPGSKFARGLVSRGQMRWFTKPVASSESIERIVLESFDNHVAPTIVAITAELR